MQRGHRLVKLAQVPAVRFQRGGKFGPERNRRRLCAVACLGDPVLQAVQRGDLGGDLGLDHQDLLAQHLVVGPGHQPLRGQRRRACRAGSHLVQLRAGGGNPGGLRAGLQPKGRGALARGAGLVFGLGMARNLRCTRRAGFRVRHGLVSGQQRLDHPGLCRDPGVQVQRSRKFGRLDRGIEPHQRLAGADTVVPADMHGRNGAAIGVLQHQRRMRRDDAAGQAEGRRQRGRN